MSADEYAGFSRIYDLLLDWPLRPMRRAVVAMIQAHGFANVLDVGGGTGRQCQMLAGAGISCLLLDHSPGMLAVARRRRGPQLEILRGDATALPLPDGSVDAVLFSLCLHEMEPGLRRAALAEAGRVGRRLVVADYARDGRTLPAARLAMHLPERLAGRRHYRMFRDFMARGGAEGVLKEAGYRPLQRHPLVQGAMVVILASP